MKQETSIFTVRLPVKLQERLDALAENMDRSRSWLVLRIIEEHLDEHEAFVAAVKEGVEAASNGEFATEEEVEAVFNKYKLT